MLFQFRLLENPLSIGIPVEENKAGPAVGSRAVAERAAPDMRT
jgi:hypothetical protein